jgi:hypothetical protein
MGVEMGARAKYGAPRDVIVTVRLTRAEVLGLERRKGHLSRSEYIRALVLRDIKG